MRKGCEVCRQEIGHWKRHFRILGDWKIDYLSHEKYAGQTATDTRNKRATIYAWQKGDCPVDFILHEVLHIAMMAINGRDSEEGFIKDVCQVVFRDGGVM